MLRTGSIVAGYRIERSLGQGGMGVVYEATQLGLNRTVALKFLAAQFSEDVDFRERFRREGVVQAGIDHPHIVPVYEAGEVDGGLFLAMRLVRGSNLKQLIVAGELDPARGVRILAPVADALAVAHEAGLTHRDIKPQNILVGAHDHGYLADFGLTKGPDVVSLTRTGQFLGTIDYVAPEVINGEEASARSDTYALAAVLFECLAGEVPYKRPSEAAVLFAHVTDPPPLVSARRPALPTALDEVIARGMAKAAADRPASPRELLADAERALAPARRNGTVVETAETLRMQELDEPDTVPDPRREPSPDAAPSVAAPAGPPPRRGPRPAAAPPPRRRARRAALAGAAVLVVALAAAGFLLGGAGDPPAAPPEPTSSVASGGIGLEHTSAWRRVDADGEAVPGIEFRDPIALAPTAGPPGARLVAGHVDATGPSLLPTAFLERLDGEPARDDPVELGDAAGYRYAGLQPSGVDGRVDLYTAPTSAGVATIACVLPPGAGASLQAACADVAGTLELTDEQAYPLGPDRAFATRLDRTMRALGERLVPLRRELRGAKRAARQGAVADDLASEYRRAAGAVGRGDVSPAAAGDRAAIEAALDRAAAGYDRLAAAARDEDRRAFDRARRAIRRAETSVRGALGRLDAEAAGDG